MEEEADEEDDIVKTKAQRTDKPCDKPQDKPCEEDKKTNKNSGAVLATKISNKLSSFSYSKRWSAESALNKICIVARLSFGRFYNATLGWQLLVNLIVNW